MGEDTMQPVMTMEELESFLVRDFPQVADDFRVVALGPMRLTLSMTPEDRHLRPGGTVSGPTLFMVADCAVYLCVLAMVGPEALAVTTNASIDFMRKPELGGDLRAEVQLLKLGRALVVGDVLIYSEGLEPPVARASMTYSRPR